MEQDALRSAWSAANTASKNNNELIAMLREGQHPVLTHIRRQLIIETIAFTIFLFLYYNIFDGDRKPLYANLLIAGSMLLVITHNIIGYVFTKSSIKGNNIKQSLEHHLVSLKKHAAISIICRALMAGCLLAFFASVISFTASKYWALAAIVAIFFVQLIALWGIWLKRIRKLKGLIDNLAE
ncbi:MAG TPA: hypothetical protein VIM79_08235 [Niastella sp.]